MIVDVIPLRNSVWQKTNKQEYSVDYVDRLMPASRHYGHPGRLTFDNGDAIYEPESRQLTGIKWFGGFFIPLFSLAAYFFIPGNEKWLFVIAGPTVGTLTFGIIYYLIKQDIDAGPYIQFIAESNVVALPRLNMSFNKEQVVLQWITGRLKNDNDVATDLNLIVQDGNGDKYRYYVMGGPYRKYVKQFAEHAGIPVVEINMGWKGRRDMDRDTVD